MKNGRGGMTRVTCDRCGLEAEDRGVNRGCVLPNHEKKVDLCVACYMELGDMCENWMLRGHRYDALSGKAPFQC
jgi:hypothetical protein